MNLYFRPEQAPPSVSVANAVELVAPHHYSLLPHSRHTAATIEGDDAAEPRDFHPLYLTADLLRREAKGVPLTKLTYLSLDHLATGGSPELPDRISLLEHLEACPRLQELSVARHALSSFGNLAAAKLGALTTLSLADNRLAFEPDDAAVARALESLPALTSLDVSGNRLTRLPSAALAAHCPRLRILRAARNRLDTLRDCVPLRALRT